MRTLPGLLFPLAAAAALLLLPYAGLFPVFEADTGVSGLVIRFPELETGSYSWSEVLGAVGGIAGLLALLGVWLGQRRLAEAAAQGKAQVLLDLAHRWNSDELKPGKDLLLGEFEKFEAEMKARIPKLAFKDLAEDARDHFAGRLDELQRFKRDKYAQVAQLFDFFETVARLVRKGYVDEDDVLSILGGDLRTLDITARTHLEALRRQEALRVGRRPRGDLHYEGVLWLGRRATEDLMV